MTMKLDLDPEIEARLLEQAKARGLSLEGYVKQLLHDQGVASGTVADEMSSPKRPAGRRSLVEVFAPLRELDLDFRRNESAGRPVDL